MMIERKLQSNEKPVINVFMHHAEFIIIYIIWKEKFVKKKLKVSIYLF
jgi:hypothetical protein